jgi:hypothetical protein
MVGLKVKTQKGIGELENIFVSELGYLMIKIQNKDKSFTTYNLGKKENSFNLEDFKKLI